MSRRPAYSSGMDVGEGAALAAAVIAVGAAFAAAWQAWSASAQARYAKEAADAAKASAVVSEKALRLAEERFEAEHPTVAWSIERIGGSRFRLVNTGRETATGVTVTAPHPLFRADFPTDVEIAGRGGSMDFTMVGSLQAPLPSAVNVQWDGHPGPRKISMPPR